MGAEQLPGGIPLQQELPDINWAGFYKMTDGQLILGPFQGKTACICIPVGKGVCGTAVAAGGGGTGRSALCALGSSAFWYVKPGNGAFGTVSFYYSR